MDKFIILIVFGLLTNCVSHKGILDYDYLSVDKLALKNAVDYEKKIGSVDKTPNHHISISTGIYPNKDNYELATPQTFLRDKGYFENQVRYYYSTTDSSVRVILYQWDTKDLKTFETRKELEDKFKEFIRQWNNISEELNNGLGLPTFIQIESNKYGNKVIEDNQSIEEIMSSIGEYTDDKSTSWTDQLKWDAKNVHAYLFMFGDNKTGYREILLAIFGE